MSNKKLISFVVILCCVIMAFVDGVIMADYVVKSAVKILLFIALPSAFCYLRRGICINDIFIPDKKGMKLAFSLCIPLYLLILGAYFLLKDVFDFSAITTALTGNIGVTKQNFIYVSLYISFVNSLLEEFFFRGFAFLTLKKVSSRKYAYLFSSIVFALYHVSIMTGWFSPVVFALALLGLFIGGLIFNYLDERSGNIYTSWFVHMFANFAINTVGFILFGLI